MADCPCGKATPIIQNICQCTSEYGLIEEDRAEYLEGDHDWIMNNYDAVIWFSGTHDPKGRYREQNKFQILYEISSILLYPFLGLCSELDLSLFFAGSSKLFVRHSGLHYSKETKMSKTKKWKMLAAKFTAEDRDEEIFSDQAKVERYQFGNFVSG